MTLKRGAGAMNGYPAIWARPPASHAGGSTSLSLPKTVSVYIAATLTAARGKPPVSVSSSHLRMNGGLRFRTHAMRSPPDDQRADPEDDEAWCLDTLKKRPKWFTDPDLFTSGVAANDNSYRNSGFDRGHMAMKLLVCNRSVMG